MTTPTNSALHMMEGQDLQQMIRNAGGIVHSDGNIFSTNAEKFMAAARTAYTSLAHFADEVEASEEALPHGGLNYTADELEEDSAAAERVASEYDNPTVDAEMERRSRAYWAEFDGVASGEAEKHAVEEFDDLDRIEQAINYLKKAQYALNRTHPETATGKGYVQDAQIALSKVQP